MCSRTSPVVVAASLGEDDDGSMQDVQDVEGDSSTAMRDFVVSASGFYICAGFVSTTLWLLLACSLTTVV